MRLSPAVKLGSKMISHQTQPPQEVLCSVSAALLILACGAAVEQSAADSELSCLQDHGQL